MPGEGRVLGADPAGGCWLGWVRPTAFPGEVSAAPGKIRCLQRGGVVSHPGGRSGGDARSCCLVRMGWGVLGSHSSSFPLPCLLFPASLCVSMGAATHHLHHHLLTLYSPFQASKAWRKNKMDESKHEIHSQVDAITAGTASVVNLTAGMWKVGEEGCPISGEGLVSLV